MSDQVRIEALSTALQRFARNVREFTWTALARDERQARAVLCELGDPDKLDDANYRAQLAKTVVGAVMASVEGMSDRSFRRCAEAALALNDFHGKPVCKRKDELRIGDGILEDFYKKRRPIVFADITLELVSKFAGRRGELTPICLCGNYFDTVWDADARTLGRWLAEWSVSLVSGYARPGEVASLAMLEALEENGIRVEKDRVVRYARDAKHRSTSAGSTGNLITYGRTQAEKRHEMIPTCKLVVLFGGREGTAAEARIAEQYDIPIIPLGFTGGAAEQYWNAARGTVDRLVLGGHPVDATLYALLGDGQNRDLAMRAAFALIGQAIMAVPADTSLLPTMQVVW